MNYYNENNLEAAAWLNHLIMAGEIPDGWVDTRSIVDVSPADLRGFVQYHFFAGIGGWPLALRLAGWPSDRPVWTGSCPCQPFSAAGKQKGLKDERHLWPEWARFIRECRPGVIFGEQVASKAGLGWFDAVSADLEDSGYAVGAVDICAAGLGAPHIRQRLWLVAERLADTADPDWRGRECGTEEGAREDSQRRRGPSGCGDFSRVADTSGQRIQSRGPGRTIGPEGEMQRTNGERQRVRSDACANDGRESPEHPSPLHPQWRASDWLFCRDGKWRPVEPGSFPLVDGLPGRVGLLRGYGNAIVPQVAAEVIGAYLDVKTGAP